MKNLKINNCLFHGIRKNSKQTSTEVLQDILKNKYILTHNSLRNKGICHERENISYQGMDALSICIHPDNYKLFLQFENCGIPLTNEENGFNQFISTNNPSIILSPDILQKLPYRTFCGYKRLIDEIQIISDISLNEMIAIGYGKINSDEDIENIMNIYKLLKKENYQIPVVNPLTGIIYEEKKLIRK